MKENNPITNEQKEMLEYLYYAFDENYIDEDDVIKSITEVLKTEGGNKEYRLVLNKIKKDLQSNGEILRTDNNRIEVIKKALRIND
tara:strand:+ start:626 stop:883 length:258 start_codon:yes stop_codon:yes gene_type:complete